LTSTPDRTPILTVLRERWVAIVLVILTAAFVAQNRNRVELDLFWMNLRLPLWLVMTVIAAVGVVVGLTMSNRRRLH
jgi:putative membrane protein